MKRRTFLGASALGVMAGAGWLPAARGDSAAPPHFLLSSRGCGRATGYEEANKIVTCDGKTHVAWLDSEDGGFHVRVRTLDRASGAWSPTYTVGAAFDNHGGPALTIDSAGHLHIAYYPHHHPMRYRRSSRPNDASAWEAEEEFGEKLTYPTLLCGSDDTLYCSARQSTEGYWRTDLYTKRPGGAWEGPTPLLISEQGGYAHFMDALCWGPKETLHLSARIFGGRARFGHTVGYMRSEDHGATWRDAAGRRIQLPATAGSIDVIDAEPASPGAGLRAGSVAVDGEGKPYVLYSNYSSAPPSAWLAWPSRDGLWRRRDLGAYIPEAYEGWGLITPGAIAMADDGAVYIAASLVDSRSEAADTLWGRTATEVLVLSSRDGGESFTARVASSASAKSPRWLPSLERPTGHNRVGTPGLMYTAGGPGATNAEIVANDVYWVDLSQ